METQTRLKSARPPRGRKRTAKPSARFKKHSEVKLVRRPLVLDLHVHEFHGEKAVLLFMWKGDVSEPTEPFGPFVSIEIKTDFAQSEQFFQELADSLGYEVEGMSHRRIPVRAHSFEGDPNIYFVGYQETCLVSSKISRTKALRLCKQLAAVLGWELS